MNTFIDSIYGTLINPKRTFALLAARQQFGKGIVIFLIVNLFSSLAALLGDDVADLGSSGISLAGALPAIFLLTFLLTFVMWFTGLGILHLLAELLGGHGSIKSLIATQGFAQIPAIFIVPFAFLAMLAGDWLVIIASLFLGIWSLVLSVLAIRFSYDLTTGRSVLVVLLPLIIATVLILVIIILLIAAIWPIISDIIATGGF